MRAVTWQGLTTYDEDIQLRMGNANFESWVDSIMPLLTDADSAVKIILKP